MADTLDSTGKYVPKDLQITSQPDSVDKDKFKIVIDNLKIDSSYAFQFQYVFPDGELSDWSPGINLNTSTETVPGAPSASVSSTGSGFIPVTLNSFPTNAKRVDVVVIGGIYGTGKVLYSFFDKGSHNIPVAAGPYTVVLLAITPSNINGDPTNTFSVTVTDPSASLAVTAPQDPFAPTVRAGLAAVIVEWSGKKSDGTDLTTTGFDGAKVHIGTTSGFTPSNDNWVHTLNFANGSNRVSIGVGSVINKTAGTTLAYGVPYYIKLVTVNAIGDTSGTVSASNNPVTVAKLPASEISTGILTADASITAGIDGGSRVVMSGGSSPLVIYGTDGTTKLLEFIGGSTGTLSITGSGTFTGNISGATGTLKNALNIGTLSVPTWGGRGYPFSVDSSGNLEAGSGKIGGWVINTTQLRSNTTLNSGSNQMSFNPATPKIALTTGNTLNATTGLYEGGVEKITIDPTEGIVGPNITYNNTQVPAFKLAPSGTLTLYGNVNIIGGQAKTDIDNANATASAASSAASAASTLAASKIKTYYQSSQPTGGTYTSGDIWFDTGNGYKTYRYNGSTSQWDSVQDSKITNAIQKGGNYFVVDNASNQLTQINSNGITISTTGFTINTDTTAQFGAGKLVMNSAGISARDSNNNPTFTIDALSGDASFTGTINAKNGTFSGNITSTATISGGTIQGSTIKTSNSTYIQIDGTNPGTIRLHANGFSADGYIDYAGDLSGDPLGQLTIQPPTSNDFTAPYLQLYTYQGASTIELNAFSKIYFSINRDLGGNSYDSPLVVSMENETFGLYGDIPVANKSIRKIFAGTTSLPDAYYPYEDIGTIYLEY